MWVVNNFSPMMGYGMGGEQPPRTKTIQEQVQEAWQAASAANQTRAQATLDFIRGEGQANVTYQQGRMLAEIGYLEKTGAISVQEAAAARDQVQARGQGYIEYLTNLGAQLLQNLTAREGLALDQFVRESLYNLDQTREITGEGARIGYGGVRRFGVKPTEEQVKSLPQYATIQQQYQQQRNEAQQKTALDLGLANTNLQADMARANSAIGAAQAQSQAGIDRQQQVGQRGIDQTKTLTNLNYQRALAQAQADQQDLENQYNQQLQRLQAQQQQAYQPPQQQGGGGGQQQQASESGPQPQATQPGVAMTQNNSPSLGVPDTGAYGGSFGNAYDPGYGMTPGQQAGGGSSYYFYARGGVTALARAVAARRRLKGIARTGS